MDKVSEERRRWACAAIPLAVLLLGAGLCFYRLDGPSLWEDEIFTATRAPWPLPELIAWTADDVHPPLYYLLIHGLLAALGASDWLLRWPSAVAGVLSLAAVYRLGRELFGRTTGALAMSLLALSPFALRYGQEARMHSLFMLLSLLSALCLVSATREEGRRWWAAFALVTALNLYTIYFAFLVLGLEVLWIGLLRLGGRKVLAPFALSVSAALALYLPWWPTFLAFVGRNLPGATAVPAGPVRSVGPPLTFLVQILEQFSPGLHYIFPALFFLGAIAAWRRGQREGVSLLLILAVPSLLFPLLLQSRHSFYVRYLIYALPPYILGVGRGLALFAEGKGRAVRVAVALLPVAVGAALLPVYGYPPKTDWKGVGAYLSAHATPGDLVAAGPLWDMRRFLGYYYGGPAEVLPAAELSGRDAPQGRIWWLSRFGPEMGRDYTTREFPGLYLTFKETASAGSPPCEEAISFLRQAVQKAPIWVDRSSTEGLMTPDPDTTLAMAHLALGDAYRRAGRLAEAIAEYEAATAELPGWVDGRLVLASAYEEAGSWREAARTYEQILQLRPDWAGPHVRLAQEFAARKQWAEATVEYKTAIQVATSEGDGQGDFLLAAGDLPTTARPGSLVYGGRVRLLAYELDKETLHPGDILQVVLYWQVLAPVEGNYLAFVHLLGRERADAGQADGFPAGGRYPTDRWQVGEIVRDAHLVQVSAEATAPAVAQLDVGFYDRLTMRTLPAADQSGQPAPTTVARLKLIPHDWPMSAGARPVEFHFGQEITLVGYEAHQAEDALEVTLYWRAERTPQHSYTVFVHLLDDGGRIVAQHDGLPDGGEYPTDFWAAGELIADRHRLSPGAAGEYRLAVGLYLAENGERLPLSGPGGQTGDAAGLGPVEIKR